MAVQLADEGADGRNLHDLHQERTDIANKRTIPNPVEIARQVSTNGSIMDEHIRGGESNDLCLLLLRIGLGDYQPVR
jgi:hypothetical protein